VSLPRAGIGRVFGNLRVDGLPSITGWTGEIHMDDRIRRFQKGNAVPKSAFKNVTALWSRDVAKKFEERKAILEQDKKHRQRLTSKLEKAIRSLAKNRNILAHFTILGSIPKEAEGAVTLRLARSMYDARHKAHLEHDIKQIAAWDASFGNLGDKVDAFRRKLADTLPL
jgi:hypothetical protein